MHRALGRDVGDKLAPTFVRDTAAKTGLSERTIERAVSRAEKIAPEIRDEISEMPGIADRGVELDALAKLSHSEQAAAVSAVKSGEAKSVREISDGKAKSVRKSGGSEREKALAEAAGIIAKHVLNIGRLIALLETAGVGTRLVAALKAQPKMTATTSVDGSQQPDPEMWRQGRLH